MAAKCGSCASTVPIGCSTASPVHSESLEMSGAGYDTEKTTFLTVTGETSCSCTCCRASTTTGRG